MKLYITPGSPYARMTRVVVHEKGLGDRVEIVTASTRTAQSPYYEINPSGRVPYLVREDGVGLEDSALICAYLDHLDGVPTFDLPPDVDHPWEARRLEAVARSTLDGFSVWARELARAENERSPALIRHERDRAARLLHVWEREIAHPLMRNGLHLVHLALACALGLEARIPELRWGGEHPRLRAWFDEIAARPSFVATAPPGR
jgi:glutathione S-transferase